MKQIKYERKTEVNLGTEDEPNIVAKITETTITCPEQFFEANYAIAEKESCARNITVEEVEDPVTEPTQLDQIEAQVTYTALMTDTLLEEV